MESGQVPTPYEIAYQLEHSLGNPRDPNAIMSYKRVMELDESESFQEEFFQFLLSKKIHHLYVPVEFGGKLYSYEQLYAMGKVLARRDLATAVTMSTMVWSTIVWVGGSAELKKRCAELTLSIHGAQCLAYSEEHHGADLLANECIAEETPDGFIVKGEKWPINRAARSDVVMLLAKTSDGDGGRDLSVFMIEKSKIDCAKYTYLPKVKTHGLRGCDICGIRFDNALIPKSALIGKKGQGLELAIKALQVTRTLCVGLSVGALENNLRVVMDFALNRKMYGGTVYDIPNSRHYLIGAFADLMLTDAMGVALTRALHVIPQQFGVLSAVAKCFAPLKLDKTQKDLATILGARFFFREKHCDGIFQKSLRDSQVVGLFDGSSEVNLYSLCTQLPLLARRQKSQFENYTGFNEDKLKIIFNTQEQLPDFNGNKLDLAAHGKDFLMESFPLVLAELAETKEPESAQYYIATFLSLIYLKHKENISVITDASNHPIDIRSPKMFNLAKQYCTVAASIVATHYWLANKSQDDEFFQEGAWLALGLQRLLLELHVETDSLPNELQLSIAQELKRRTEKNLSYGVIPMPLPDTAV